MKNKLFAFIGAGVGLGVFLAIGLLPAILYGGYAGVMLANGIFGTPIAATLAVRALVVFGMALGTVAVGSLFAVTGAATGAAIGALTNLPAAAKQQA